MPREPKIRRDVPWAWAASTIARASRRKSASPRATKDGSFGMVARGEAGGLRGRTQRRMWEARRSQRASRESLGPYKDVYGARTRRSKLARQKLDVRATVTRAEAGGGARAGGEGAVLAGPA